MLFEKAIGNIEIIILNAKRFLTTAAGVLTPFVYGLFIAYFLNAPMRFIETKALIKIPYFKKRHKLNRLASALLTYIIVISCIVMIFDFLVPEVINSVKNVIEILPKNYGNAESQLNNYLGENNLFDSTLEAINDTFLTAYTKKDVIDFVLEPIVEVISTLPTLLSKLLTGTINFASALFNFALGAIIALYMLCDKDNFKILANKFLLGFVSKKRALKLSDAVRSSNELFEKFIIGKFIDSAIIGLIFFFVCLILKLPYAVLLCVIIGVTNMIPYFGPFIGALPVIIIVFLNNPLSLQPVWALIAILCVQQFDGIILGPKILGDSTGLRPIGVIFSILVGGALMGVFGMFFGVPIFAVIRNFVYAMLDRRIEQKTTSEVQT